NATNSPPINITFFGTSDCDNLPFGNGDAAFGCPTNGPNWVNLGSTLLSGGSGNQWVKGVIEVVPNETIRAIAIGPECLGTRANVNTYYFFDNLLLSDFESFELKVAATAHPCNDDFTLQIADIDNYVYQWYKDGIALIGETSAELTKIYGEGNYQVRLDDGLDCRVSANFTYTVPVFSESINRTICKESTFQFGDLELDKTGIYVDTFRTEEGCKNIVNLDLKVLGTLADTVQAKIFEGEQHIIGNQAFRIEGDYLVNLTSDLGCDSLVLLQLDYYKVYLPNAFSPNFDNTNDVFTISSENELIENIALSIFDRWGNLLFKGMEWDGQYKGKVVNPGVFFYVADITMNDGITRQFSGDITVLK
ncbi:MAG: gliding motility-associated C-terminal domain-containing protein, partial [Bacteroidota bacterium]